MSLSAPIPPVPLAKQTFSFSVYSSQQPSMVYRNQVDNLNNSAVNVDVYSTCWYFSEWKYNVSA